MDEYLQVLIPTNNLYSLKKKWKLLRTTPNFEGDMFPLVLAENRKYDIFLSEILPLFSGKNKDFYFGGKPNRILVEIRHSFEGSFSRILGE